MKEYRSCAAAEEVVIFVAQELMRRGLIASWVDADTVSRVVTRCTGCRSKNRNPRNCTGWKVRFGRHAATLRFSPVAIDTRTVELRLECDLDFSSKTPSKTRDWCAAPLASCTVAVEVYEAGTDDLIVRQHLDLANIGQAGPAWHLQLGGKPARGEKPDTMWLKVPRWPASPTDFILIVEFILFSFYPEAWRAVSGTNPWQEHVKTAERLVLPQYVTRLNTYMNTLSTANSWLAAQANNSSDWNPRPAR